MNVSGSRATADINLDEFERRLRAAGTQQPGAEDPLSELARLVESSRAAPASSPSPRKVSGPARAGGEPAEPLETVALRPSIVETRVDRVEAEAAGGQASQVDGAADHHVQEP